MLLVYILKCSDKSYYTGVTNDIERRLSEHESGVASRYTKTRKPLKLMWTSDYVTPESAIACEKQIKKWTRAKKEALIKGDFERLRELSVAFWKK